MRNRDSSSNQFRPGLRSQYGQRDVPGNRIGYLPFADVGSLCDDGVVGVTSRPPDFIGEWGGFKFFHLVVQQKGCGGSLARLDIHAGRVREHQRESRKTKNEYCGGDQSFEEGKAAGTTHLNTLRSGRCSGNYFFGSVTVNRVPLPSVLCTSILPLWASIVFCTSARPRPVP